MHTSWPAPGGQGRHMQAAPVGGRRRMAWGGRGAGGPSPLPKHGSCCRNNLLMVQGPASRGARPTTAHQARCSHPRGRSQERRRATSVQSLSRPGAAAPGRRLHDWHLHGHPGVFRLSARLLPNQFVRGKLTDQVNGRTEVGPMPHTATSLDHRSPAGIAVAGRQNRCAKGWEGREQGTHVLGLAGHSETW